MSRLTIIRESPLAELWSHIPTAGAQAVGEFRREVDPEFVPSGISGLLLSKGDHVALVVDTEAQDYLGLIRDFLIAGYRNGSEEELLSMELTEKRDKDVVSADLEDALGRGFEGRVDIRDWEANSSDFEEGVEPNKGYFTLPGMWQAMNNERRRMNPSWKPMLRCASEDCSLYIRWLENPLDYLRYESRLAADLERIVPSSFVQLCTFRTSVLQDMEQSGDVRLDVSLAEVLASHNRIVLLDDDGLHLDDGARDLLIARYSLNWWIRASTRSRAIANATRARLGRSPAIRVS